MSMSKIRKSLQAKLRRKFKWSTGTDFGKGASYEKLDVLIDNRVNGTYATDICVGVDRKDAGTDKEISVMLTRYKEIDTDKYRLDSALLGFISFEELELLYNSIKAFREEETNNDCGRIKS